ncbi:MAG: omptin family outer membrane protease [Deltaproteobacteria bacterium]|nr:omptin family outer membrane protease [Deltaproteobacteria bacterium]
MRPIFLPLFCGLLLVTGMMPPPEKACAETIHSLEFGLDTGFRVDQLDWNTAGSQAGQNVNVLTAADLRDLDIWQVGARGKVAVGNNHVDYRTYIRGSLDYGWLTDGAARYSDYHGNNRTNEVFRANSSLNNSNVIDASIGLGFEKDYQQGHLTLGWLGGYSYHEQNLSLTGSRQLIPTAAPIAAPDSTYISKWRGPFAGLDLELRPWRHFSLLGSIEYHWVDYEGKADWNLRNSPDQPISFRHNANNGTGLAGTLRCRYLLANSWNIDILFAYRDFSGKDGTTTNVMADGTINHGTLNEVDWTSYTTSLGFSHRF